jgi:hypothetical protein
LPRVDLVVEEEEGDPSDEENDEGGHQVSKMYKSRRLCRILTFRKNFHLIISSNPSSTANGNSLLPTAKDIFISQYSGVRRVEGAPVTCLALLAGSETGVCILILQYYYALKQRFCLINSMQ